MKRKLLAAACISAALATLAGSASAASTASAGYSNLTIQLNDLNTADGITPGMTIIPFSNGQEPFYYAYSGVSNSGSDFVDGAAPFAPINTSASSSGMAASTIVSGDALTMPASLLASASRDVPDHLQTADSGSVDYFRFTLTPDTRVVVTGTLSTSATSNNFDDFGSAGVWISLTAQSADGQFLPAGQSMSLFQYLHGGYEGNGVVSDSSERSFSFVFDEISGTDILTLDLETNAGALVATVPEPSEAALMLSALALALSCGSKRARRA